MVIMKSKKALFVKFVGIGIVPLAALLITQLLCISNGVVMFETQGNWIAFFRSVTSVMLTTFALSINLNSGRFDFSIGSVSLLSSVIASQICIKQDLALPWMLGLSLLAGVVLGMLSGLVYVIVKLPPIIVSLGVALFYEGMAFAITKGYGVSFVANTKLTSFPSVMNYLLVIIIGLTVIILLFDYTKFGYNYRALVSGQKVAVNTGIKEVRNAVGCYAVTGGLMGMVGFISATNTGNIQMSLNFGSIGVMFTAFLPMFIGSFIGRFCNERIGYCLGAVTTAFISLMYARLDLDSSIQQISTALVLVCFLIYLNNEGKIRGLFMRREATK